MSTTEIAKTADTDIDLRSLITEGKNPRGIPAAVFIDDVEKFLTKGKGHEILLGAFQELYSKYKYMEQSFDVSKAQYKQKIPELEQTLDAVKLLKKKQEDGEDMYANYSLSDTVYTKTKVDTEADKVCLWIGANVMVEYTSSEAITMLEEQLVGSAAKLEELNDDLYYLRENIITVEVNMARIVNHSVRMKKLEGSKK